MKVQLTSHDDMCGTPITLVLEPVVPKRSSSGSYMRFVNSDERTSTNLFSISYGVTTIEKSESYKVSSCDPLLMT